MTWGPVYLRNWRGDASSFTQPVSSFWPWKHQHQLEDTTFNTIKYQLIFILFIYFLAADEAVVSSEGLVISLTSCMHHCYKQVSCRRSWGQLSRLSGVVDLYADMSFRINQAYQSDRCLFTCYKHLPRLALLLLLLADYLQGSSLHTQVLFTLWLWL